MSNSVTGNRIRFGRASWRSTGAFSLVAAMIALSLPAAHDTTNRRGNFSGQFGGQAQGVPQQVGQQGAQQDPQAQPLNSLGGIGPSRQGAPDEFTSIWSVPTAPSFAGFPVFPARLPGYGNYSLPVNPLTGATPADPNSPFVMPLAPAEPEPRGWPTWIRVQAKKPLPFDTNLGLLVSQVGRVWHRDSAGEPFEPLFAYDKFASLPVGAEVETRGDASFDVLLHESTRVQAHGLTRLRIDQLDESTVALVVDELSWLRISATGRINRCLLPDGSSIELQAPPSSEASLFGSATSPVAGAPAGGEMPAGLPFGFPVGLPTGFPTGLPTGPLGLAQLFGLNLPMALPRPPAIEVERIDEPGWYGGRATLSNQGGTDVIWRHAFGETRIPPDHRVTLFLSPPGTPTSKALVPGNSRVEHQGERITCYGLDDGVVQWCSATIALPKGARVTFESLGGEFGQATGVAGEVSNPKAVPTTSATNSATVGATAGARSVKGHPVEWPGQ